MDSEASGSKRARSKLRGGGSGGGGGREAKQEKQNHVLDESGGEEEGETGLENSPSPASTPTPKS